MSSSCINLSKNDEWYTPKYIVEYFGKFDYDPATTKEKAEEFDIVNYDTIDTDGLKTDWTLYKRIWLNPPFTKKKEFLSKAVDTFNRVKNNIYIVLPVSYLTTKQFYEIIPSAKIYLPNGRIAFEKEGNTSTPALGTIIIKLDDKWSIELLNLTALKAK